MLAAAIRPPLEVVSGSVSFDFGGKLVDPTKASEETLKDIRWKNLSYIMQGSMSVLNPVRRIEKSFVDFAQRPLGLTGNAFWDRVKDHLEHLKLPPTVLRSYPHELSGGMRQRVTIGLATVCHPEFIIADEPTTALDVVVQKDVLALLRNIQQEIKSSVVFVTHDMAVHANITDRVGIIYAGRLVEEARTRDLFRNPKHPYTAHLVGQPAAYRRHPASARRSRDGRQTLPTRLPVAVSIRAARWPSTSAAPKRHLWRRWARNTRSACWRADEVRPVLDADMPIGAEVSK